MFGQPIVNVNLSFVDCRLLSVSDQLSFYLMIMLKDCLKVLTVEEGVVAPRVRPIQTDKKNDDFDFLVVRYLHGAILIHKNYMYQS